MIEIVNRQRKIKIETRILRQFAAEAFALVPQAKGKSLTIAFVSDCGMQKLNRKFCGKNKTTDVLSFPRQQEEFEIEDALGDIAISAEQAARQAAENHLSLEKEIKQLILHGILHLCGYDHENDSGEMNRLELKLRDKLGIS
jgi:probable rRNA maturation factor